VLKLQGYGIAIDFEIGSCAIADGGYCVRVVEENPSEGADCAEVVNVDTDSSGTINSSPLIRVRDDSWSQTYLNWLMNHEFGHLLGLDDPSCTVDKTVMHEYQSLCNVFPDGSPSLVPTDSDAFASANTAYRGGSTATCPVQ
jgi:hypothetical protein